MLLVKWMVVGEGGRERDREREERTAVGRV